MLLFGVSNVFMWHIKLSDYFDNERQKITKEIIIAIILFQNEFKKRYLIVILTGNVLDSKSSKQYRK